MPIKSIMVQAYNCFLLFAHVITLKPLQEEIKIVKILYVFLPFFRGYTSF